VAEKIKGFDYVAGTPVEYTAREWREKYPAADFHRVVRAGETWYSPRRDHGQVAAEAYGIIPAGK
jgi:hypothetical protein